MQLERLEMAACGANPRAGNTGELVGWTKWGDVMDNDFGSPYYHIHRADFHQLLLDLALPVSNLRLSSTVVAVDATSKPNRPSVTLSTGERLDADLIIGADGVKSMCREVVLGAPVKATATGDAAYRVTLPTDEMAKHPELKAFVDSPEMTGWMGPGRHIMAYCIVSMLFFRLPERVLRYFIFG